MEPARGTESTELDPVAALPVAQDEVAATTAVATLRAPLASSLARNVVDRLFLAFHARNVLELDADIAEQVWDLQRPANEAPRSHAVFVTELAQRLRSAPFDQLPVELMYQSRDVEVYTAADLSQPGRPMRPSAMIDGDLLVRIPILTQRLGADLLFGEDIRLLLRRDGRRLLLCGYGETTPQ